MTCCDAQKLAIEPALLLLPTAQVSICSYHDRAQLFDQGRVVAFAALNDWMRKNSGFVERYRLERDDLESVALLAVWNATEKWQPERGTFSTLANVAVHSRLAHHLARHKDKKRGAGQVLVLSLDARLAGDETCCLGETIAAPCELIPEQIMLQEAAYPGLWEAVAQLTPKQAEAVRLCYQDGLRLTEAARYLGVSQSCVSRRLRGGLKKLRQTYAHPTPDK